MTAPATPLLVERDGAVVTLRLDRPHVLNALDGALVEALLDAVATVARDAGRAVPRHRGQRPSVLVPGRT